MAQRAEPDSSHLRIVGRIRDGGENADRDGASGKPSRCGREERQAEEKDAERRKETTRSSPIEAAEIDALVADRSGRDRRSRRGEPR